MAWYFAFFLVSGFCGILYELVWLRLAMAQFAVTTPFVSIVLSVFMGGLGLGSWAGGRYVGKRGLRLYALTELLIGVSAILVPLELSWGRVLVQNLAGTSSYYLVSGIWIALALTPWCACMGATYPFAMSAIRDGIPRESPRSFSFLYLANISGAVLGSLVPLALIETLGFKGAARVGMVLNLSLAVSAFTLASRRNSPVACAQSTPAQNPPKTPGGESRSLPWLLFATGLTSMGVELIWVRMFTPFLGTVVYAFAGILCTYLAGTYAGSQAYRRSTAHERPLDGAWLAFLGFSILLPVAACNTRWLIPPLLRVAIGVVPFSAAAGFLTPMILDKTSWGDPVRAGRGYAINIIGCVVGPLLSGFLLLPLAGERTALVIFALPWLLASLAFRPASAAGKLRAWPAWVAALAALPFFLAHSWETEYSPRKVRRDHTATVVAAGSTRTEKRLLINGVGITSLTPITKMMAHLTLAHLRRRPENALVICFGMGTTHRSALSWGIRSTAVELTPSVPPLVSFFHADGAELLKSSLARVVVDDGRSYLERTRERYDAIVIDPPPPVEAAASSLLYSREFYAAAKPRLRAGGILQQWLPGGDSAVEVAVAKALKESFPYTRVYRSIEGWGYHFLASAEPLPVLSPAELAARLPARAAADLVEWGPHATPELQFAALTEFSVDDLIRKNPGVAALEDDRPINEYYLLRSLR